MIPEFTVTRARHGEGAGIARMIRRSLAPRLRPLTIWESPRAGRYVEAMLSAGAFGFYILRSGARPAGVAAFRRMTGSAFLNHLYVSPQWRGRALGARLLVTALRRYLDGRGLGMFALDVFAGHSAVEAWYARLGLIERERRGWWIAPQGVHDRPTDLAQLCRGLPEADRQHREWGFSSFRVRTATGRREVGRLSAPYFRLTSAHAAADPEIPGALRALAPRRRILVVAPGEPISGSTQVAVSRRLECPVSTVLRNLSGAC